MKPMGYLKEVVKSNMYSDTTLEEHIEYILKYRTYDYSEDMLKGDLFPIPVLEYYSDGSIEQEGNHRAMAVQLLIDAGHLDKDYKMPVVIMKRS